MKKTIPLFSLICLIQIALTLWVTFHENNPLSLEQYLQQKFPQTIDALKTEQTIDFSPYLLDSRPAELLNVELFLPHYQDYEYSELKKLFDYSNNCLKPPKIKFSPDLQKTFTWVDFSCKKNILPKDFFKNPPYISPSGKSFVKLAQEQNFDFTDHLSPNEIENYQNLSEVLANHFSGFDLNLQQLKGLIIAEDVLTGENSVYIKRKSLTDTPGSKIYLKLNKKDWLKTFESQEFKFEEANTSLCLLKVTNGCWTANKTSSNRYYRWIVFFLDGLLALTFIAFFLIDKRRRSRQKENQRFILQMLTHELRTPVTTLSLLLENIRNDFDQLSSKQQIGFLNMSREMSRLKNSMQMSYAYLQTDNIDRNKLKIQFERLELNSFLSEFLDKQELGTVIFSNKLTTPTYINAEKFWLSLCLTNLIRNSFDHAKPPVQLTAWPNQDNIKIEIQDAGDIAPDILNSLGEPFQKGTHSKGLGLGLSIIQQIIKEMNGQWEVQRLPTRFCLIFRRLN